MAGSRPQAHGAGRRVPTAPGLLAIVAAALLALGGCASVTGPEPYPPAWAPPEHGPTATGCPSLSGVYANAGAVAQPAAAGPPPTLSEVFARMGRGTGMTSPGATGRSWPQPGAVTQVRIAIDAQRLTVAFLSDQGPATELAFRRYRFDIAEKRFDDLFTCHVADNGNRLRFFAEPEGHAGVFANVYLEGGGTLVFLLAATDGDLVVQWRKESVALSTLVVGSHVRFDSVWWKYPRVRPGTD